jgi:hypothetical protein
MHSLHSIKLTQRAIGRGGQRVCTLICGILLTLLTCHVKAVDGIPINSDSAFVPQPRRGGALPSLFPWAEPSSRTPALAGCRCRCIEPSLPWLRSGWRQVRSAMKTGKKLSVKGATLWAEMKEGLQPLAKGALLQPIPNTRLQMHGLGEPERDGVQERLEPGGWAGNRWIKPPPLPRAVGKRRRVRESRRCGTRA